MIETTLIFWDIDGTLLRTGRAGIKAWEDAVLALLGVVIDLSTLDTAGRTDLMIADDILAVAGAERDRDQGRRLADSYAEALPERLTQQRGGVLPHVAEILAELHYHPGVVNALLTGNVRTGARAKLESYGLASYFDTGGFGDDGFIREEIGRTALARVQEMTGPVPRRRTFLVGDSPFDVACAHALGLRMVAVATGDHAIAELAVSEPWWVVPELPAPGLFTAKLGLNSFSTGS